MKLNADISPEELKVFLEETEELIGIMDTGIVSIEKDDGDSELLHDVFRAAHTIKGSSAMVGFTPMAELTHAMENLLDELRNHKLTAAAEVVNALLHSLHALKELKDQIIEGGESSLEIEPLIEELRCQSVGYRTSLSAEPAGNGGGALVPDDHTRAAIRSAEIIGENVYRIHVVVSQESAWAGARLMQATQHLERLGKVLHAAPSIERLENDDVGHELEALFAAAIDEDVLHGDLASIAEISEIRIAPFTDHELATEGTLPEGTEGVGERKPDAAGPQRRGANGDRSDHHSIQSVRLDVQVLDDLMNIVEELVIDRSRIGRVGRLLADRYSGDELVQDLGQTSDHIIKVINQLQDNIMKVRMIPIGSVFSRFPRLVRDLAQMQHKEVDFAASGGETELDRSIIEQIRDPLIHLLRNCIDHGVESAEERQVAGKPAMAKVRLGARQDQEHILITLSDDGRGIDGAKVRDSAIRKGLVAESSVAGMSAAECVQLVFLPGVSTTEKVTDVSGRGVGMDIVRSNIENLGGSIRIETEPGKGTSFIIRLPLTVAIIQGLLVSAADVICVLPMSAIQETLRVATEGTETVAGREVIRVRDSIIPLLRLNTLVDKDAGGKKNGSGWLSIAVVSSGDNMIGLVVDQIMEPQEIVVKPLGSYLGDIQGIAGVTICSTGEVALILDVSYLAHLVSAVSAGSGEEMHAGAAQLVEPMGQSLEPAGSSDE